MSEFIESEAEESEDEEVVARKRKKNHVEDDDDDEEEEDDEEKLREEMKDLINDEEEEEPEDAEDEGDSDQDDGKRKRRHEEIDDALEDDDYDLIEENLGVKVQRKKQFKRVRRFADDESDEEQDGAGGTDEREAIANDLFEGSDEGEIIERPAEEPEQFEEHSGSEVESDEDDFIVDDDGQPISKGKKKRQVKYTDSALQEAQDIFGVDFDYQDFEKYQDDYEDEIEEEYEDEDEGDARVRPKKTARKKSTRKTIYDVFEPSELIRGHLTDRDNRIKVTDIPERFQLRYVPLTSANDEEIEEEAEWIYKQAFSKPMLSNQSLGSLDSVPESQAQPIGGRKGVSAVPKIREALKFMRNQQFEVPFIAFYRKEYVEPELKINDLWTVYKWDEKWCQLQSRKEKLVSFFHKMQNYQCDEIMKEPDKPLSDSMRLIDDNDFLKLGEIQGSEELRDAYLHLNLYHGQDIPAMQEAETRQKRKKRKPKKTPNPAATPNPDATPNPNVEGGEDPDAELAAMAEDKGEEEEDEIDDQELTRVKHSYRKNFYGVCRELGLDGLAKKFGLTPEQFGENLRDNYQRHEVEQYPIEPTELAGDYINKRFTTADEVLTAARHMVALQLSRDLVVRRCVRQVFFERAKVCVKPTKKGIKDIDENHPCYSSKYIKNKPVKDLLGDQFLKLMQAEKEGEITLSIVMDKEGGDHTYLDEIKALYERDEFSTNVQEWNKQRTEALEIALKKFLYPTYEKELRSRLSDESREGIIKMCRRKLYNWLKVAPYQVDQQIEEDEDFETRDGIRVMAVAYLPDRSVPAFAAIIDGNGSVTDYLRLPRILMRKTSWNEKERQLKLADLDSMKRFISSKKPHVVVVSGESREALGIVEDIKGVINDLVESDQFPPISVEQMDNELATVYMNTKIAENDFRDYPMLLRQAVSLARRMQDPLAEFSQLCTFDQEILCLKFHPRQNDIAKEELLDALYLEFVNRTNEVGVDVNSIILYPHTSNLMQFVCGLGPRKASQILKILKQNQQRLESRTQLVTVCKMGPQVLINCAGFIKIDTSAIGDSDAYLEVLDGSRVHPEAYDWARKMAVDALEYDDESEDVNPAGALEEILENPEKLKDLDLDAFAEELERQGFGNKSIMLYDIRAELNHRYKDLRTAYKPPTGEEIFNMLTKETPQTFYIGKMVLAHVIGIARRKPQGDQLDQANPIRNDETGLWQCPFCLKNDFPELSEVWNHFDASSCPGQAMGVRVRLDNGISGFIPTKLISDNHVTNPEERVKMGMTINCRITKIIIEKFQVDLSCRSSDLADKNNEWRPPKDLYYDFEGEDKDKRSDEDLKKKHNRQTYVKRVIVHPSFHNINFKESEALLAKMDQGDLIIRPSSKGVNHLTVTWKVYENINQHIDVKEEGKEKAFSLGQSLWIGTEEFEDLDEIIARHVQPMASYARDLVNFKYFVDSDGGKREDMEKLILDKKKKKPSEIPYLVSASAEFPGKFIMSYMPRLKPKHEYITVTPEGFRYRNHQFHSINSVFKWFKEHFRDPIPRTPQSVAARTPAGRSSAYIGATPNINLSNVDPQAIQRAAANLPSHVFSALSQVTGQTPSFAYSAAAGGASTPAAYSFQAYTPSQPIATPLMTPSYHTVATPAQSVTVTPRYPPQTPQNNWPHPATTPRAGGATPRQTPQQPMMAMPTHHHQKMGQRIPTHPSMGVPPSSSVNVAQATAAIVAHTTNPAKAPTATDWRRLAAEWAKKNQQPSNEAIYDTHAPRTPRTPRGGPSPMVESTPIAGDATPLIDEL